MTIELLREGDSLFQFHYFGIWQKVLDLARLYGWEPEGTSEPPNWYTSESQEIWKGQYDLYLGERVSDPDAAAIAAALKAALDDLPDNE
ncbi:MAG: hypothetical protein K8I30_06215, partial [Anaerolineae bacterium]|nr:hypothetical protein [Anaerolineae bacterium]